MTTAEWVLLGVPVAGIALLLVAVAVLLGDDPP